MADELIAVAPHVGAWIEITTAYFDSLPYQVAPHVGAWIEIVPLVVRCGRCESHPTWVRGLK